MWSRSGGTSREDLCKLQFGFGAFPTQCTAGQCLPVQSEMLLEFFLKTAEDKNKLSSLRTAPSPGLCFEAVEKFKVLSLSMMVWVFVRCLNLMDFKYFRGRKECICFQHMFSTTVVRILRKPEMGSECLGMYFHQQPVAHLRSPLLLSLGIW